MSDNAGCTFSEQAAARIAATVRRVEAGDPTNTRGPMRLPLASPQRRPVSVRPTTAASGGGKYTGFVVIPSPTTISSAGNVSAAELGTNGPACLILNAAEEGQTTHDLTSGTPIQKTFAGNYLGMSSDATPVPVYSINGFDLGCE